MFTYRYLQPEHAEAAAKIHIEGQPGTLLTLLGYHFLVQFYRSVVYSKWAEGIGVFDQNGKLIAQSVLAISSEKFFDEFKVYHLWRVTIPVALAVLKNPKIFSYVLDGWRYADLTRSPERECDVLFLGVKREYMRQGIAPVLLHYMFGWTNSRGLISANFMVDKRNRAVRWLVGHQLKGYYLAHEVEAYGRSMMFFKVPIADNLEESKMPSGQPYTSTHIYTDSKEQ